MDDIILSTQNGEPVASSRDVAKRFGKEHKHVLAAIRQLLVAENSATKFFHETEFEYRGQKFPEYLMNRDGFSLLAMGFTGKEAVQWKLKYIEAFNQMEKQLAQRPQLSRAELMAQALIAAHDELEHKDAQIAELTPKGIFADAVSASKKSILVGELAKLLCQNGVQIGQNRLFSWMREHGYLIRDPKRSDYNMPTQRAVEMSLSIASTVPGSVILKLCVRSNAKLVQKNISIVVLSVLHILRVVCMKLIMRHFMPNVA